MSLCETFELPSMLASATVVSVIKLLIKSLYDNCSSAKPFIFAISVPYSA
jgi:hypothetical protein